MSHINEYHLFERNTKQSTRSFWDLYRIEPLIAAFGMATNVLNCGERGMLVSLCPLSLKKRNCTKPKIIPTLCGHGATPSSSVALLIWHQTQMYLHRYALSHIPIHMYVKTSACKYLPDWRSNGQVLGTQPYMTDLICTDDTYHIFRRPY